MYVFILNTYVWLKNKRLFDSLQYIYIYTYTSIHARVHLRITLILSLHLTIPFLLPSLTQLILPRFFSINGSYPPPPPPSPIERRLFFLYSSFYLLHPRVHGAGFRKRIVFYLFLIHFFFIPPTL